MFVMFFLQLFFVPGWPSNCVNAADPVHYLWNKGKCDEELDTDIF